MNSLKKKVDFYIALGIIVILGVWILYLLKAYLQAIFAAVVLTFLFYPLYESIYEKLQNKTTSAMLVILGVFLLILIPLTIVGGVLLNYISTVNLSSASLASFEQSILDYTGIKISITSSIMGFLDYIRTDAKQTLPQILSFTSNFLISIFIMFFVMFYLMIEKQNILKYIILILPFTNKGSKHLLDESGKVVKAVLIGQVLTAAIQGLLGMLAFIIAGVKGAILWGIVMIILSIIPVVGAFMVWIPAGILLILDGSVGRGLFVLLWGAIVVSQIDNIIRPKLVNKFADIHPLETLLGVFMGIAAFGLVGIVLGPLLISLFKILIQIFIREYVSSNV